MFFEAAMIIWSFANIITFSAQSADVAAIGGRFEIIGVALAPAVLLHLTLRLTKIKLSKKLLRYILYIPSIILIFVYVTPGLVASNYEPIYWGYVDTVYSFWFFVLSAYTVIYTGLAIFINFHFWYKSKEVEERKKYRLLVLAFLIPLMVGIFTEIISPIFDVAIIPLTSTSSTITAIILAIAISRHELLKITPILAASHILNNMVDQLVIFDRTENIILTSNSLRETLGYSQKELIHTKISALFKNGKEPIENIVKTMEKSDNIQDLSGTLNTKEGTEKPVSINVSKVKDRFGGGVGYLLIMRDKTEINKLVDKLKVKTRELEESKSELEDKNIELENLNKQLVRRELEMKDIKDKIRAN
jgi:PAS domain S-box-containing protein